MPVSVPKRVVRSCLWGGNDGDLTWLVCVCFPQTGLKLVVQLSLDS